MSLENPIMLLKQFETYSVYRIDPLIDFKDMSKRLGLFYPRV